MSTVPLVKHVPGVSMRAGTIPDIPTNIQLGSPCKLYAAGELLYMEVHLQGIVQKYKENKFLFRLLAWTKKILMHA